MVGDSRRESRVPVAIERLSKLIPEIDSGMAAVRQLVDAWMHGEHSDLSMMEAFDSEFHASRLCERMALAKGYFEQLGIGPDANELLREAEKLRDDVHNYGTDLDRMAKAASDDSAAEAEILQASSQMHDKAIVLNLDVLAVEEAFRTLKDLFAPFENECGVGAHASGDNERAATKLQAFAIALRLVGQKTTAIDAALRPIITEQQSEIDRLKAEYRNVVQRIESDWEAEFGEPYPRNIDDWYRWAWRAGFPSERILKGDWKLSELFPCIEGYLLKLRDQSGLAETATKDRNDDAGDNQSESGTAARMSWQVAADRMERLRQQGEPFTSQPKLAEQFGCSSATINKAVNNTPSLKVWAKIDAVPKAQSINEVVLDKKPQERDLRPDDEAAIREYLEREDISPEERAFFNGLSTQDQLDFLDDPDANNGALYERILSRKP